jgi:hypothetical protein
MFAEEKMKTKHFLNIITATLIAVIFATLAGCGTTSATTADGKPGQVAAEQLAPEESAIIWTLARQSPGYFSSVAYGNGKFIAVGAGETWETNKMAYSTDGITWTEITNNVANDYGFSKITFCGGRFFAHGPIMLSSTDGENWTVVYRQQYDSICGPVYGNGKWVFAEYNGLIMYSTDGVTWTAATNRPSGIKYQSIGFGSGNFIVADDEGNLAYSTDGVTWTVAQGTHGNFVRSIAYGDGKFVRSGWSHITYSEDGITWKYADLSEIFGDNGVYRIAYGGGKFVGGSHEGKLAYSTDGVTWTAVKFDLFGETNIKGIAYGNGRFVIVGCKKFDDGRNESGKIAYSNMQE